jgi:short subunit dehydrogenase-like uncharacterized protein
MALALAGPAAADLAADQAEDCILAAMPLISRQTGPIAVYGATGYTGRLVAAELAEAGADFVISGRNAERLEALRADLGLEAPYVTARIDQPSSLRDLLSGCSTVINCAGPFVLIGEPVLRAAVETSTHYLDTSGEQPWMKLAFERYGPGAADAGIAVIPAMGFDYVPGDMLASLTAEGMGEVDDVTIAYGWFDFEPTRGTTQTTLEILSGQSVEWRKLQWLPAEKPLGAASFDFPQPIGRQRMLRYPAGEQITVPRHIATRRVRTLLTASTFAPTPKLAGLMQLLARPTGLALRTPLKRAIRAAIARMPEGPSEQQRAACHYTIVCDVTRGKEVRRGTLHGRDPYGITAALIARGAREVARSGFSRRGALAPSQAFDPREFLAGLERFELGWQVEESERRVPVEA